MNGSMNILEKISIVAAGAACCILCCGAAHSAPDSQPELWTLEECVNYALENNIDLQRARNTQLSGMEDTEEAKAAMFPDFSASIGQSFVNYPSENALDRNSYTDNYSLDASVAVYQGGKLRTALKQAKVQNAIDELSVSESENDIRIAIVSAYMQVLYAKEAVEIAKNTALLSKAQRDRAEQMYEVGSVSKVDFAQFESQYVSDEYQVVVAKTSLDNYRLQLKQLLELDITEEIDVVSPDVEDGDILKLLPEKEDVYSKALEVMPQVKRGEMEVEISQLGIKYAKSGYYPSIMLNAGVGTAHLSGGGFAKGTQIWNRFNENVGLTVNVPIYSNRRNKSAVNRAKIEADNSVLSWQDIKKTLLENVESAYLDAMSAQSQYVAAKEREKYANQSYVLTDEQFRVGMKNTVELLSAYNEYVSSRQEVLQAKYMALLNMELLDIYQGKYMENEK